MFGVKRGGAAQQAPPLLVVGAVVVTGSVLLPILYLVLRVVGGGADLAADLINERSGALLVSTVALAVAVSLTALVIALPAAWLTQRTDLPGKRIWTVLVALPLVIPSYVAGYTYVAALGPRGLVQGLLSGLGVERIPEIYGFFGAWLVLSLFTYPYLFLTLRSAMSKADGSIEEAARTLGKSPSQVARTVLLPQLRPAMASGALLVALYTLHDFGAVSLLRFDTFTRAIYLSYQGSFDRTRAAGLSLLLVAVALVAVGFESRSRPKAAYFKVHGGGDRKPAIAPLGKWRWPAIAGLVVLSLLTLGLPAGVTGWWLIRSLDAGGRLRLASPALLNSLQSSGLGTALALLAAWPVAMLSARFPGRLSRWSERFAFTGYALPGLVVALALVFFGIRLTPALYQTRFMLAFAYMVLFLPQATAALGGSLAQLNPRMEEASRTLGLSRLSTSRRIVLPLVRPGLAAGAALVFLTSMKELPATLLLAPAGFPTLATQIWSFTNTASFAAAAIPALILIALASAPLGFLLVRNQKT